MINYIVWSIEQLYLIICLPTTFRRRIEGEKAYEPKLRYGQRIRYLLKLLPLILILASVGNFISGHIYQYFARPYSWGPSYIMVLLGIAAGGVFGATLRAPAAIGGGIAGGVVLGVVGGVAVGVLPHVWIYLATGAFVGPVISTLIGLWFRKRRKESAQGPAPVSLLSAIAGLALAIGIFVPIANGQVPIDNYNGLAVSLAAAMGAGLMSGTISAAVFGLNGSGPFGASLGVWFGLIGSLAFGITGTAIFGFDLGVNVATAFLIAFPLSLWATYFRLINYPFTAVTAITSYLFARQSPHAAIRAWKFCPAVWDEVIWLPLPYLDKFLLLLMKHDREYGLKQAAFISTARPLQRQAVLASASELILDDLNASTLSELSGTSDRLSWTTQESVSLDASLISVLTIFERIAQHAKQYLSVHSDYRKKTILENALMEVNALTKSLLTNPAHFASRLLHVTEQWSEIIVKEQKDLAAQVLSSGNLVNPFITGEPVREDFDYVFTGRKEIVWKIEESILGRKHTPTLLLYGPRRMGKTSILKQLPRLLGPEFAPIFVDCQNPAVSSATSSVHAWLAYLSVKMCEGLRRRRVTIEPLAESDLEKQPFSVFDRWLNSVEQALPGEMRVLLCLDEYESLKRILKADWGIEFLDLLRHVIQHRPSITLMFCGAHTFAESGPAWTSRFINAKLLRVSFLSFEEVLPLLTKPIPEFDLRYEPGVLEALYTMTRGQPYLTQLVASELVEYLNEQQRKQAGLADLQNAVSRALESGEYFYNIWFDAGNEGQAILRAIAMKEAPPDFAAAKEWLKNQEVLKENETFAVPMVELWMKERMLQTA